MSRARVATNVLAFQAAWFAIVGGAASDHAWLIVLATAAVVLLHLGTSVLPLRELAALAFVAGIGIAWDSVPVAAGWVEYRGAAPFSVAAPYWIAALWLAFATTLNVTLRWLRGRWIVAAALGAVGGPVCYLAGEGLGALQFLNRTAGLAAEAVAWALLLPISVALAARLDGVRAASARVPMVAHA